MTSLFLLIKSVLAGFIVAVPIGAIGAMCLRRALQGRWAVGLVTGSGAATADSILAAAAMFGLTLLTRYIFEHQGPVLLVGGVFLIVIGIRMIHSRRPKIDRHNRLADDPVPQFRSVRSWLSAFSTGFALTIINPATFIAFVGVFAGMQLFQDRPSAVLDNWSVIVGVFIGSMLWWMTLTGTAYAVRRHLSLEFIVGVNAALGVAVVGFGVASILSVFGWLPYT